MPEQPACIVCALGPTRSEADECISDVVSGPQMVDNMSGCVEYRLELADQVSRQANRYV